MIYRGGSCSQCDNDEYFAEDIQKLPIDEAISCLVNDLHRKIKSCKLYSSLEELIETQRNELYYALKKNNSQNTEINDTLGDDIEDACELNNRYPEPSKPILKLINQNKEMTLCMILESLGYGHMDTQTAIELGTHLQKTLLVYNRSRIDINREGQKMMVVLYPPNKF
jgi:hypothetical protein